MLQPTSIDAGVALMPEAYTGPIYVKLHQTNQCLPKNRYSAQTASRSLHALPMLLFVQIDKKVNKIVAILAIADGRPGLRPHSGSTILCMRVIQFIENAAQQYSPVFSSSRMLPVFKVCLHSPVQVSQILAVPSNDAVTMRSESAENIADVT